MWDFVILGVCPLRKLPGSGIIRKKQLSRQAGGTALQGKPAEPSQLSAITQHGGCHSHAYHGQGSEEYSHIHVLCVHARVSLRLSGVQQC